MMRVVSYNVHGFVGADGRRRPQRIAAVLAEIGFDLAALQEVEWGGAGGGASDQLEELARATGADPIAGPTMRRTRCDYGNAVLSRVPLRRIRRHVISVPGHEPRGAIELQTDGELHSGVRLLASHLGLRRREREQQIGRLLALVEGGPRPVVLAADLNEWWPFAASLRRLRAALPGGRFRRSFPARWPLLGLDRIMTAPEAVLGAIRVHRSPLARRASDHLPVVAELDDGGGFRTVDADR